MKTRKNWMRPLAFLMMLAMVLPLLQAPITIRANEQTAVTEASSKMEEAEISETEDLGAAESKESSSEASETPESDPDRSSNSEEEKKTEESSKDDVSSADTEASEKQKDEGGLVPAETPASQETSAEPETTESESAEPETTESETAGPETTESEAAETETTESEAAEPETTESETAEPKTTEPKTTESETAEPKTTESETAEPETTEPKTTESETAEPKTTESETAESETAEPKTTESETAETKVPEYEMQSPMRGDPSAVVFAYEAVEGGLKITDWNGVFDDDAAKALVIPASAVYRDPVSGEEQEKPVISVGANVFTNKGIQKLTIGANVQKIESYAFANNKINELLFAEGEGGTANALKEIGPYAFMDNDLRSLNLPPELEIISNNAFSHAFSLTLTNTLTMGTKVKTIGDNAFDKNNLTEVTLPDSVTEFGNHVFVDNGRFVAVATNSPHVKKFEKVVTPDGSNRYGHAVNPIVVIIECIDEKDGTVLSRNVEGEDLSKNNVFVKGETVPYQTREIPDY